MAEFRLTDIFAAKVPVISFCSIRSIDSSVAPEKDKGLFKNILKNIKYLEYQDNSEVACSAAIKWMKTNKPETFKCDMHDTVKDFLIDFNSTKNN